jgi:3-hydroxyisobutyrate dehydrogenase
MSETRAIAAGDRVGFIGLGNMGVPMALRLLAGGFVVVGYDQSPEVAGELDAVDNFVRAGTLEEACRGVRVVILMLPNSTIVASVLRVGSVFSAADRGTMIIDMSSSQPISTVELSREAHAHGLRMIDAPVSGGVPAAKDGSLTVMVGGPDEWVEEVSSLVSRIGTNVVHAGGAGAGHALKAINNFLSASTLLASSEALVVGSKFGLKPEVMMNAVNVSSGRSWSSLTKWPRYIFPRNFASGFMMSLLVKDTRIAVELAHESDIKVPYAERTLELWEQAMAEFPEGADHTDIHRFVERHSGHETPKVERAAAAPL